MRVLTEIMEIKVIPRIPIKQAKENTHSLSKVGKAQSL